MSQLLRAIPTSGPGSGTVTSISAGTGITLTPNPITTTGTVALTIPVTIANGGTNATTMATTDGTVYYDGTRLVTTATGTAGQVLTSGGAGVAPAYASPAASSISITGDSGGALTGAAFTFTGGTTGLTFTGAGTTETLGGTLAIANGGTNATSMSTSTGIVKYDGTRLVTSSAAKIDSSNRYTNSAQPAFLAYLGSVVNNVTGNGTAFTIGTSTALTIVFDQASNFNSNGTFTAPVTGRYLLSGAVNVQGATIATAITYQIVTTNRTYESDTSRAASNQSFSQKLTAFADMTAGDTCTWVVTTFGEASNTDDITGASTLYTYVCGNLVC